MSQISSVHHTKDMADHTILHPSDQNTPETRYHSLSKKPTQVDETERESDKAHLERKNQKN